MPRRRGRGEGSIAPGRQPDRWRLRWRSHGRARTRIVYGTRSDAQKALRALLAELDRGGAVGKAITISAFGAEWLDQIRRAPKTLERYRQLFARQIVPHLGTVEIAVLRPVQVRQWHRELLGTGLHARTVRHAHALLRRMLSDAVADEMIPANPLAAVRPPRVEDHREVQVQAETITALLSGLEGHRLLPIAIVALATGCRRGELLALRWRDVDLDAAVVQVARSLEQTAAGLRFKMPKTRAGVRTISLPIGAIEVLRRLRIEQAEFRLANHMARIAEEDLIFVHQDGSPYEPDRLSRDWGNVVRDRQLPRLRFHDLRHAHASHLLAAGLDVVEVAHRLGHSTPSTTLNVYSHVIHKRDDLAAKAADRLLRGS